MKKELSGHATEIILESISDGVFTVDDKWQITSFNRAAEKITGISRKEAIGKHCWEVFRSNMCETDCALKRTMKEGKPFTDGAAYIVNSKMRRIPINVSTALLKDKNGKVMGGVETFLDMTLVEELKKELSGRFRVGEMISKSPLMHRIFNILPKVARSGSTVVIRGETGTGKELLAKAIHELSPRKDKPFVAINCGALPDTLLESELFGYKKGAFTDAKKDKPGLFSIAKGGTVFLDEIGDISQAFQVRLLRVLTELKFMPLGATKEIKADVRIITATNKDLEELVKKGEFRQDFFYRINVLSFMLPPLRDRKEDIPLLSERFISRLARLQGKTGMKISPEAMQILMSYDYPGNIRELENIIEYAFVLCDKYMIMPSHLPEHMICAGPDNTDLSLKNNNVDSFKEAQAQVIIKALERNNYNRLKTAKELGIHKSTLFRKIKALGIRLP